MASDRLESELGLQFRDPQLLEQALVHRSFVNENGWSPAASYERMEYLGDAVLGLVISDELYRRCPDMPEGELTKSRSTLVRRETLSLVAQKTHMGDYLRLGKGEESSGGRHRDSILAAVLEAVVAAVYLDRDYQEAKRFILDIMAEELDAIFSIGIIEENPKSCLQEFVQARGSSSPSYRLVSSEGPDHGPLFTVEVLIEGEVMGIGQGGSKSSAESTAARMAMTRLGPVSEDSANGRAEE
ncbi:MAG: ribonuclease III [SAR202 cluster bacterium Io17-Chloro-G7]|nr:MAG: ribonuclease III [SAR202 cluster bacterium Io17-Chloro-G7]